MCVREFERACVSQRKREGEKATEVTSVAFVHKATCDTQSSTVVHKINRSETAKKKVILYSIQQEA